LSIAAVENFDHDNFLESCTNSEHCNSWNNIKINIILQQHMLYLWKYKSFFTWHLIHCLTVYLSWKC